MSIVSILASYMLGSLIFSVIVGRLVKGVDIRQYGSGNAGATNTLRVIGIGPAILVFLLDLGKGLFSVWAARWLAPESEWLPVVAGVAAIVGHNWPIWFRFRGGKGIATTIGMLLAIAPIAGLIAGVAAIITIISTRYVSLGSLIFTALIPAIVLILAYPIELFYGSLLIMAFAWFRHRTNIVKLLKGQENKLGSKSNARHG